MSKRLGEVLIERGLIDEVRLKMGLDAQLIYGGHLGTCLVELGFVDLDSLGQTLAGSFNVEHAHRDLLENIPEDVLHMLPPTLVEKHRAIPFEVDGRTLRVAMVDPRNLLALDELSFGSGCKIEPWVAPEILVVRAMELYYQVSRRIRHIAVSGNRPKLPEPAKPIAAANPAPTPAAATPPAAVVAPPPVEVAPPPAAVAPPAVAVEEEVVPLPSLVRESFVPQMVPSYQRADEGHGLFLDWIKMKPSEDRPELWCDLFELDFDQPYFDDLEGVYVVWYHGRQPVLRVGQGKIRMLLQAMQQNDEMIELAEEHTIYASWTEVQPAKRSGIERYLIDMLNPRVHMHLPPVEPIAVNLPR